MPMCTCEFELYKTVGGTIICAPLGTPPGMPSAGTFGVDEADALGSALDWLRMVVEDHLIRGVPVPAPMLGNAPQYGGHIVTISLDREKSDIPGMSTQEAAEALGCSIHCIQRMMQKGILDYWQEGEKTVISSESVHARDHDLYGWDPGMG